MRNRKNCIVLPLLVIACAMLVQVNQADAQRPWVSRTNWNRGHRFAGAWYSDGYHVRTPGPNVNHYQPWSSLNTSRFSPWQKGEGYSGYHDHSSYQHHSFQESNRILSPSSGTRYLKPSAPVQRLDEFHNAPPSLDPPKPPLPGPERKYPKQNQEDVDTLDLEKTFPLNPPGNYPTGTSQLRRSKNHAQSNMTSILQFRK